MVLQIFIVTNNISLNEIINKSLKDERDVNIVGITSDPSKTINECQKIKPDIVLVDIEIPFVKGVDVRGMLRVISPSSRVIYIGTFEKGVYNNLLKPKYGADYIQHSNFKKEIHTVLRSIKNHKI